MFPFIRHNRAKWENTICANNLREIGLAMYIYAREHDGEFPPSLAALYEEQYLADEQIMDCPADRHVGTPEDPDYIYVAGLSIEDPSLAPLVYDKAENHSGNGRNSLFLNGTVTWEEGKAD